MRCVEYKCNNSTGNNSSLFFPKDKYYSAIWTKEVLKLQSDNIAKDKSCLRKEHFADDGTSVIG